MLPIQKLNSNPLRSRLLRQRLLQHLLERTLCQSSTCHSTERIDSQCPLMAARTSCLGPPNAVVDSIFTSVQRRSFSTMPPSSAKAKGPRLPGIQQRQRILQINTTKALLDLEQQPRGSFNEQTWLEIEVNIELWSGERQKEGLTYALQLLERMVQEEEIIAGAIAKTTSKSSHINTHVLNSIIDSWRICWHTPGMDKEFLLTPKQMLQMMDDIERRCGGILLADIRTYTMIIDAATVEGADRDEEDPFQMPIFAESVLNRLIEASATHVELRPNKRTFNAVMEAWLASGSPETPSRLEALLQQMRQYHRAGWADVQPTVNRFNLVLHRLATSDQVDAPHKTELLLQAMHKEDGLTPNLSSYLSVLTAWSRSDVPHAPQRANAILEHMQEHLSGSIDTKPTRQCYHIALNGFIRRGLLDQAQKVLWKWSQVWQMTGDDDLRLTRERLHNIMHAISKTEHQDATKLVEAIFEHFFALATPKAAAAVTDDEQQDASSQPMKPIKFQPNTSSFNCVLAAWKRNNDPSAPERCDAILYRMLQLNKLGFENVSPDRMSVRQAVDCWINSNRSDSLERAENLLFRVEQEGAQVTADAYEILLEQWSKSGDQRAPDRCQRLLDELIRRYDESQDADLKPRRPSFVCVISTWVRSGRKEGIENAKAVFDIATSSTFWSIKNKDPVEHNYILDGYAKNGDAKQAEDLLLQMEQGEFKGVTPNEVSYTAVLEALSRSKDPEAPERAQALFDKLKQLSENGHEHLRPSVFTYSAMMNVWARCWRKESVQHAISLFHEMIRRYFDGHTECKPTPVFFNSLLDVLAKNGEASQAETLLQYMIDANFFQPSCLSYSTVLSAWARSSDQNALKRAQALFDELVDKYHKTGLPEMKPNDFTFGALISAWGRSGRASASSKAVALLDQYMTKYRSEKRDFSSCKMIYKQTLEACQLAGDGPLADKVFQQMLQLGIEVDVGNCNTVLLAWGRTVNIQEAAQRTEHLLKEMVRLYRAGNENVKPNRSTFRAVLATLAHSGLDDSSSKVIELFQLMQELDVVDKSDCLGYNFILDSYARAGQGDEAETLLRSLVESGEVKVDLASFHHVIKAWTTSSAANGAERAEAIFQWLQELNQRGALEKCQPTATTYSTVIQAWSRSADRRAVSKVGALVKEMISASLTPTESIYVSFIMSIAKSDLPNKHRRAEAVLKDMKRRGIEPNSFTQDLLASIKEQG